MSEFTVVLVRHVDGLLGIRDAWNALAARAAGNSFSQTYEYTLLAAQIASAAGHELKLLTVWDADILVGAWPLHRLREGMFRVIRPLSCGSNEEYSTPLVQAASYDEIVTVLFHEALSLGADVLQVFNVRAGDALNAVVEASPCRKRIDALPAYGIRLDGFADWDAFAASLSKSMRTSLRYEAGRLGKLGRLEAGWCATGEEAASVLRWIFDTKRRWAKSHGRDAPWLSPDDMLDFFIELATRIDLSNTPMVSYLKLDGVPIAASINLVGPRSVEYFVTTYNEDFALYSPGKILIEHCVRWALLNRRDFDFRILYGDYKARWSNNETSYKTYILYLTRWGRVRWRLAAAEKLIRRGRRAIGRLVSYSRKPRN